MASNVLINIKNGRRTFNRIIQGFGIWNFDGASPISSSNTFSITIEAPRAILRSHRSRSRVAENFPNGLDPGFQPIEFRENFDQLD